MKINVVFKNREHPRAVLRFGDEDYFVVTSEHDVDIAPADELRGDLTLLNVKWLLNLTRGRLINISVLGRYVTQAAAIQASTAVDVAGGGQCGSHWNYQP